MDAPELTALQAYRENLPEGRLMEFAIDGIDRLQIPVYTAVLFPPGQAPRPGTGFGFSEAQARVGALGELTEDFNAGAGIRRMPLVRGGFADLRRKFGDAQVINPVTLNLTAGSPYREEDQLEWVELERFGGAGTAWVPTEFVACSLGDWKTLGSDREPLVLPITNGLGAGLTISHAVSHGLLELLQRDGNSVRYRALAKRTGINANTVDDPVSRAVLDRLDAAGIDVAIKVAGTDFGMANVYVVGMDRRDDAAVPAITAAACGEAVHPVAKLAIRKALLEFVSSRSRLAFCHGSIESVRKIAPPDYVSAYEAFLDPVHEEPRAIRAMQAWVRRSLPEARVILSKDILAVDETYPAGWLPNIPDDELGNDKKKLVECLMERLGTAGLEVLVARFSGSDSPVQVVKVIVPGLEVETMSYGRIGGRNVQRLLADKRFDLAGLGTPPAGAKRVRVTEPVRRRFGGDPWFNVKAAESLVSDLYTIYREPGRHVVQFLGDSAFTRHYGGTHR